MTNGLLVQWCFIVQIITHDLTSSYSLVLILTVMSPSLIQPSLSLNIHWPPLVITEGLLELTSNKTDCERGHGQGTCSAAHDVRFLPCRDPLPQGACCSRCSSRWIMLMIEWGPVGGDRWLEPVKFIQGVIGNHHWLVDDWYFVITNDWTVKWSPRLVADQFQPLIDKFWTFSKRQMTSLDWLIVKLDNTWLVIHTEGRLLGGSPVFSAYLSVYQCRSQSQECWGSRHNVIHFRHCQSQWCKGWTRWEWELHHDEIPMAIPNQQLLDSPPGKTAHWCPRCFLRILICLGVRSVCSLGFLCSTHSQH